MEVIIDGIKYKPVMPIDSKQEWEIVEYGYAQSEDKPDQQYISKVKRLQDGVVFSIGDKIAWDWEASALPSFEIKGFRLIADGIPTLMMDCEHTVQNFNNLCKRNIRKLTITDHPTQPVVEDKPLFTTEDGVGIKHGQDYWHVVSDWTPQKETAQEFGRAEYQLSSLLRFSTKEAAEQYILDNKPCLSMSDLNEIKRKYSCFGNTLLDKARELVNQKLNSTQ